LGELAGLLERGKAKTAVLTLTLVSEMQNVCSSRWWLGDSQGGLPVGLSFGYVFRTFGRDICAVACIELPILNPWFEILGLFCGNFR